MISETAFFCLFACFITVHPSVPVLVSVKFDPDIPMESCMHICEKQLNQFSSNFPYFKSNGNVENAIFLS